MRAFKRATVLTGILLALMVFAGAALAANPHWVGTPTATRSGDTLTVSFKAAGLGNASEADFTVTGEAVVSSRCYTKSGNKPQAANKQETTSLSTSDTFPVRNGQTTGSLTLTAPEPTLECPPGQRVVTESVTFQNVVLSGEGLTYSF
jgi:hypothetical protein